MAKRGANISLASYDDIFSTEESRSADKADSSVEKVQEIALSELFPFKDHPFKVLDNEDMQKTVESIQQFGVMTPAIARPREDGGYELISGHRRHHACELAGLETMPVIVRDMDDDAAVILMVDSNLSREEILPSERAFAFKMKNEALKHQGERADLEEGTSRLDMAEELLRRSRVVVACGTKVNENVKNDIALAKRLGIVSTTMDGIQKAGKKAK